MPDQAGREQPVEGGGRPALLLVTEHALPDVVQSAGLLLEQVRDELGGVVLVGPLVADCQEQRTAGGERAPQPFHVVVELVEGDALLVQVGPLRAAGQAAHQRQVAAVATHGLHHVAPGGGRRRQLDPVDRLDDHVQRGVGADRQLRAGQVVVDGRRHADDRNAESRVAVPLLMQQVGRLVGVPAADHQQRVDPVVLELAADRVQVLQGGNGPPHAQVGAAVGRPGLDVAPGQFADPAVAQPWEAVVDAEHGVAAADPEPDGRPRRGVHAGRQPAAVDDADPARIGARCDPGRFGQLGEQLIHGDEGRPALGHRPGVVAGLDQCRHLAGVAHRLHQVDGGHPVAPEAEHPARRAGVRAEQGAGRLIAEPRRAPPVEGAGRAAALHVTENGDPGVLAEPFLEGGPDVLGRDRIAGAVGGTLGHQHDRVAASGGAAAAQLGAHPVLPAVRRRILGGQHVVAAARDGRHQREVAAMPAHHLDHEAALVAGGGTGQVVDRGHDPVQCGVGADGHVGADQVVVDRADQAGDHQGRMGVGGGLVELPGRHQLGQQLGPFGAEGVQAGEAAVAADHHQPVDAGGQQVAGGDPASVAFAEPLAAEGADHGAPAMQDVADVVPAEVADAVPAVDHALIALEDRVDLGAQRDRGPHHRPHRRVHALGVAAAGQDADPLAGADEFHHGINPGEAAAPRRPNAGSVHAFVAGRSVPPGPDRHWSSLSRPGISTSSICDGWDYETICSCSRIASRSSRRRRCSAGSGTGTAANSRLV